MRREDPDARDHVVHVAREDLADGLVQRHPHDRHVGLLVHPLEVDLLGGHPHEVAGEEDPAPLVRHPRRGEHVGEGVPARGPVPGLLQQLPLGEPVQRLPRDVAEPGGRLPEQPPDGVPVLAQHQHGRIAGRCAARPRGLRARLDLVPGYRVYGVGVRTSELAAAADVNPQTLRYYERRGLLSQPERTAGGYRTYRQDAVEVVRFVKCAQRLGSR